MEPLTIERVQAWQLWVEMLFATRPVLMAVITVALLAHVLAWCRVFSKAGYSSALGLLALLPPLVLVFPFVLGFVRTPTDRELRTMRRIDELMERSPKHPLRRAA